MSEELEVQIVNSPYLTLEVSIDSIQAMIESLVQQEIQSYFDGIDWWDIISDHGSEIVDMVHEDLDVHDAVDSAIDRMDVVRGDDFEQQTSNAVRRLLQDFVRVENVCSTGDAFNEAVKKVANVSKADMRQELANQFQSAVIRLDFQPVNERG